MDFNGDLFRERVRNLTGLSIAAIGYPGGRSRNSVRLIMSDQSTIFATARPMNNRSTRELDLLWTLERAGVPCPAVLGVDEGFFLQSDVGTQRLSDALAAPISGYRRRDLVNAGLRALADARSALADAGFSERLEPRFPSIEKRLDRANLPLKLAQIAGLPRADYDPDVLAAGLELTCEVAVKADARPANAIVTEAGEIAWIDWDRAKCGSPLDDLISLLCDEYMVLPGEFESAIVTQQVLECSDDDFAEGAEAYACYEGVLKCCRRLDLIVEKLLEKGAWWDADLCLAEDRSGVSVLYVDRLCARGSRWSRRRPETAGLAEFFEKLPASLTRKWPE